MYSQFRVQNFRGFKDLELKDLARVNLIAGKNSVGKTSLLEALFVFMNPTSPELQLRVNAIRGLRRVRVNQEGDLANFLAPIFYEFNMEHGFTVEGIHQNSSISELRFTIKLASKKLREGIAAIFDPNEADRALSADEGVRSIPLEITDINNNSSTAWLILQSDGAIKTLPTHESRHPTYYFSPTVREAADDIADRHTKLINKGKEDLLIKALQIIDSRIKSVRQTFQNGEPFISVDIGVNQLMLVNLLGDGVVRIMQLLLAIASAENGVVMVDEIENGIHYSVQAELWRVILEAAELFNVQIFATTHSLEMIQAAQMAFQDMGDDAFRYYRLDRQEDGDIQAVKYSPKTMSAAINMDFEVRG
jgi:predicted ATPase